MAPRLQRRSFASVTLLLSLTFPLQLVGTLIETPGTPVHAQSHEAEGDRSQFSCQSNDDGLRNNPKQAQERLQSLEQELKRYQATGNRQSEAEVLECLASTSNELGQYERAVKAYKQLLALVQKRGDTREEARVLNRLTSIYGGLGDSEFSCEVIHLDDPIWAQKTIQSYEQKINYYQSIGNRWGEGAVKDCLADIYYEALNQPERAIELFKQVLAWEQELASVYGVVHRDHFLCELPDDLQNNPSQAQARLQSLEQELKRHQSTGNRWGEMNILSCLASTYNHVGRIDLASEFSQQELALKREISKKLKALGWKLGLSPSEAQTSLGILTASALASEQITSGVTPIKAGESVEVLWKEKWWPARVLEIKEGSYCITYEGFDSSWNECVSSDRIRPVTTTADAEAERRYRIGFNYLVNQNYLQALKNLEQSLAISEAEKLDNAVMRERVFNALSTVYAILGDFQKLELYAKKHLEIAEQLSDSSAATIALVRLGGVYFNRGEYAQAESYLNQALERSRNSAPASRGFALSALGKTSLALGKTEAAIAQLKEALQTAQMFKDPELEVDALEGLGIAYVIQGDYSNAINLFEQNRATAQRYQGLFDVSIQANALNNLGYTFLQSGNLQKAETNLQQSIELWESQRSKLGSEDLYKVSIFELQALTYSNQQKVLILQGKPEAALEISERGRARAFIELLAQRLSPQAVESVKKAPLNIDEIRKIAKAQNATLVEYSLIDTSANLAIPGKAQPKELAIWVIKPTGEVGFKQVDLKSLNTALEDLVINTRQSIGVRSSESLVISFEPTSDQSDRLKQLHKLLIEPIAQFLPTNPSDRVIFIPQNELFLVPFAALQDASGKYLIEKHTILTAPAIQVLQLTHEKRSTVSGTEVLVVGNPTMPSITTQLGESPRPLSKLPGAQKEAIAIANLLNTKALTGNQATKAAILPKLSNARMIHLATHGLLDDFRGLGVPGAIALAPDGTGELNDGLLTSNEILDLKLNAELVVLSACDTGRGRLTGDGVIGLSRSLITAGVPSVIVSLWSVPDAPTASLMTEFYQNLQKNPDKAQALRQAMLTTLKTHPNPKDWAAFALIGEAR